MDDALADCRLGKLSKNSVSSDAGKTFGQQYPDAADGLSGRSSAVFSILGVITSDGMFRERGRRLTAFKLPCGEKRCEPEPELESFNN